jgi:hypothetical protein
MRALTFCPCSLQGSAIEIVIESWIAIESGSATAMTPTKRRSGIGRLSASATCDSLRQGQQGCGCDCDCRPCAIAFRD